ncbi:hypothetical protein [Taylorella asinigenitalis]|uniref:hypothetical protein n=1 Tax=Taylorella asinigenitalis TaxID=84590 RepID=UPI000404B6F3|nr:hypothetical protein [Taylorella asinigenitalis]
MNTPAATLNEISPRSGIKGGLLIFFVYQILDLVGWIIYYGMISTVLFKLRSLVIQTFQSHSVIPSNYNFALNLLLATASLNILVGFYSIFLKYKILRFTRDKSNPKSPRKIVKLMWIDYLCNLMGYGFLLISVFSLNGFRTNNALEFGTVAGLIGFKIMWTWYFKNSTRVFNTYGANA